ncbi:hypothetical protein TIFTF001_055481 [Ficus carica]|uniref:Uncharacterized protein n=1 Tax=Ficus carica TaxID=3494 RepID=A0AA88EGB7_FICCA|nr:hypothetical protein TIFTF001_055481 [Ficus carica]
MIPTDKEMKEPCVAQLYLNDPTVVPQAPRKTLVMQPSTATNSDWWSLERNSRRGTRGMFRKTVSDDLRLGFQDDGFLDSDINVVADKGVKAAMDFLNANKTKIKREMKRKKLKKMKMMREKMMR